MGWCVGRRNGHGWSNHRLWMGNWASISVPRYWQLPCRRIRRVYWDRHAAKHSAYDFAIAGSPIPPLIPACIFRIILLGLHHKHYTLSNMKAVTDSVRLSQPRAFRDAFLYRARVFHYRFDCISADAIFLGAPNPNDPSACLLGMVIFITGIITSRYDAVLDREGIEFGRTFLGKAPIQVGRNQVCLGHQCHDGQKRFVWNSRINLSRMTRGNPFQTFAGYIRNGGRRT